MREDSWTNHGPSNLSDPPFLVSTCVGNQIENSVRRVHTEGILLTRVLIGRFHSRALTHANDLSRVSQVPLLLEAAQVLRRQDDPALSPFIQMLRLLHKEAFLDDVISVDDNLGGHREVERRTSE